MAEGVPEEEFLQGGGAQLGLKLETVDPVRGLALAGNQEHPAAVLRSRKLDLGLLYAEGFRLVVDLNVGGGDGVEVVLFAGEVEDGAGGEALDLEGVEEGVADPD
jgi:hypothetical protein